MPRPARLKLKEKPARLDSDAWIAAAFDALAEGGIDAVRVEPLAKALDITKGSFYWHFADRRALIEAMLASWAAGRIAAIREQALERGAPDAVLRELADLYTHRANIRGLAIELAIRSLARTDEQAAKAARNVDRERLRQVAQLFARMGWTPADAQARAILFYSYLFGQSLLDAQVVPLAARDNAIRALIAAPQASARPRKSGDPVPGPGFPLTRE
jgi:AcrR family transcriptional regulator